MAQPCNLQRLPRLIGAKIRLTSEEGEYTGVVVSASSAASKVVLEKVKSLSSEDGKEIALWGLLSFSFDEIVKFECLELPAPPLPSQNKTKPDKIPPMKQSPPPSLTNRLLTNSSVDSLVKPQLPSSNGPANSSNVRKAVVDVEENENAESLWDQCSTFKQHQDEIPSQRRPNHYVVVDFIGDYFFEAIEIIQNQTVVGCGFDGISLGRYGQLDWIEIATKDLVILFDMQSMEPHEAFKAGLRDILTSESLMKVIHDCRQISDLLYHQFDIDLVNVFDTQVADVMIHRMSRYGRIPKYVRNLAVCLKDYLAMTAEQIAFYEVRKYALESDNETWHKRPLTSMLLEAAALNVRYLRELRSATLEKMLEEFTLGVDIFLSTVRDAQYTSSAENHGELLPNDFYQLDYPTMMRLSYAENFSTVPLEPDNKHASIQRRAVTQDFNPKVKFSEVANIEDELVTQTTSNTVSEVLQNGINACSENEIEDSNFDEMPALEKIHIDAEENEEVDSYLECTNYQRSNAHSSNNASLSSSHCRQSRLETVYDKLSREIETYFKSNGATGYSESKSSHLEKYCSRNVNSHLSDCSDHSSDLKNNPVRRMPNDTVFASPKLQSCPGAQISALGKKESVRPRLNILPAGYQCTVKEKV